MRISDWSSDVCSSDLAALVELALDLDQQVGEAAQQAGRGGLVVHVGAAAAVASQHAAQHQQVLELDALLVAQRAGRVVSSHLEGGRDAGFLGAWQIGRASGWERVW